MSLLADLLTDTGLDPGYAAAAAHAASGRPRSRAGRMTRLFTATLVLGLLGAMAVVQVRRGEPVTERQRSALIAQIRQRTAETEGLRRQADGLRGQTEILRRSVLARSEEGRRARRELDRSAEGAAAAPAAGGGAVVTVDDARAARESGDARQNGRIYDLDLQRIVNALWAAGARAVSVNGQRMGAMTAIRSAGDAILVDYRPLSPPYVATAVGDADTIASAFADSPEGRTLRTLKATFGIRYDIRKEDSVRLPAAPAPTLRYARQDTVK